MKQNYSYPGWTKRAVLSVAALCMAATAAHAQTTVLATDFDGTQTVNGATSTTTIYASPNYADTYQDPNPAAPNPNSPGPTAPLATQNGWTTNDAPGPIGRGVASSNANQINGGTTYVGGVGTFFGSSQAGAVGAGVYAATAGTPTFAVPSAASNGTVTLSHAVAGTGSSQVVLNLDYALVAFGNVAKDLFAFSLTSTSGANILSLNFTPSSDGTQFNLGTSPTTAVTLGSTLNTQYHLKLTLNSGQNAGFVATITGGSGAPQTINGNLNGSIATLATFVASETLSAADKALSNLSTGGFTGASDNYLAFDNLSIAVPEPSTYAMMALGLAGLAGMVRRRRRQA